MEGKAYIESDAQEYGFEAQVISADGPSNYVRLRFTIRAAVLPQFEVAKTCR